LDIIKAKQEPRDRGFTCARRSDNRYRFSRRHFKTNALEYRTVRIIGKMHIIETDRTMIDFQCRCVGLVDDFLFHIEEIEHLLDIGQTLTDFAVDEADEIERN